MSRPKRPARRRTLERQQRVLSEKLVQARRRLLELEAGGAPERPIEVATPAVIEPKATSLACPRCDEAFQVESHEAHADGLARLREVKLRCRTCGECRSLWFRVNLSVFAAN